MLLSAAAASAGGGLFGPSQATAQHTPDNPELKPEPPPPPDNPAQIMSWNRFSIRFVDPPTFELLTWPGATKYVGVVRQGDRTLKVASAEPRIALASIWSQLAHDYFELTIELHRGDGNSNDVIASSKSRRFKSHDWQGYDGVQLDWAASADKNIAFLIDAADHAKAPYREPGVPVWIWSSAGPEPEKGHPNGRDDAYPAAHQPVFIRAFVAHANADRPQKKEAARLAGLIGDWLLTHRHAAGGKLPLFPYSTIGMGKYEGGNEGAAVNITRDCRTGEGMVDLYRFTKQEKYLDYAVHIADTVQKFQRHDGSLPYRVDPTSGAIVEDYTCDVINFPVLVEAIAVFRPDAKRAFAARRAVDWMLAYPAATNHWQGAFEDVGEKPPFQNLGNMGTILLIGYLCRHAQENPAYLPLARRLNRWVEDQFVAFKSDRTINVNCPCPQVIEQYLCHYVMEGHTANWIRAQIALHRATSESIFLDKAKAAGNAICASQFPNGEFSTWGHDPATGKRGEVHSNWYAGNAFATEVLYELHDYVKSLS